MRQPTKKQLRDKIHKLQNELFRSIAQLPDGELKKRLTKEYPDYYFISYLDKYGNESWTPLLEQVGCQQFPPPVTFQWFEGGKQKIEA